MRKLDDVKHTFNISGQEIRIEQLTDDGVCRFQVFYNKGFLWTQIHKKFTVILMAYLLLISIACFRVVFTENILNAWFGIAVMSCASFHLFASYISVYEENVTFVRDLGVQLSTKYLSGRVQEEFIPLKSISDISIAEVVHMQRIIFTLVVFVGEIQDEFLGYSERNFAKITKAVTIFKGVKPRLDALVTILNNGHAILFPKEAAECTKAR